MTGTLSYTILQHYWWIIISLLGAILVFMLFVQGGQTLLYTLAKNELERKLLVNSLGRKWELTFTTLVVFGGAFFASFPLFYSTSFGGAYWVWMAILFCFIIQAVSYEYRSKPNNFLGHRTYEIFLLINGVLGTILLGTAVGTLFTGANFTVAFVNISNESNYTISQWQSSWHGLEAVTDIRNVFLGVAVFFLSRVLAILYFINNIDHEQIVLRSRKNLLFNAIPFVIFFLAFVVSIILKDGLGYDSVSGTIYYEQHKYLTNFIELPFVSIIFLAGVIAVLYGIINTVIKQSTSGIWFSGVGTILTVFSLFCIAGLNNTVYYPSNFDMSSSLTIANSSSSNYTLMVMTYVSMLVPFVAGYIFYAWKLINNKKLNEKEMGEETHIY